MSGRRATKYRVGTAQVPLNDEPFEVNRSKGKGYGTHTTRTGIGREEATTIKVEFRDEDGR